MDAKAKSERRRQKILAASENRLKRLEGVKEADRIAQKGVSQEVLEIQSSDAQNISSLAVQESESQKIHNFQDVKKQEVKHSNLVTAATINDDLFTKFEDPTSEANIRKGKAVESSSPPHLISSDSGYEPVQETSNKNIPEDDKTAGRVFLIILFAAASSYLQLFSTIIITQNIFMSFLLMEAGIWFTSLRSIEGFSSGTLLVSALTLSGIKPESARLLVQIANFSRAFFMDLTLFLFSYILAYAAIK